MKTLIIDTSVLRAERSSTRSMQSLQLLVRQQDLRVVIPEVVVKEYLSQEYEIARTALREIHKNLEKLESSFFRIDILTDRLISAKDELSLDAETVSDLIEKSFNVWLAELGVEVIPVGDGDGAAVISSYFEGARGFSQPKQRKDFPDAFIARAIENYSETSDEISVAVSDGALCRYLHRLEGVTVYKSIRDFLNDPEVISLIEKWNVLLDECSSDIRWLQSTTFANLLRMLFQRPSESEYVYFDEESAIHGWERESHKAWSPTVEGFTAPVMDLEINDVLVFNRGEYLVDVSFSAIGFLKFCTDYAYHDDPTGGVDRQFEIVSMSNDGIVEVREPHNMRFHCDIDLFSSDHSDTDELEQQVRRFLKGEQQDHPFMVVDYYKVEVLDYLV